MKYNTKHKNELILFLMKNADRHLTISEIHEELPKIPQATLYRLMDSLCEDGLLRKYTIGPNSSCCYQYNSGSCHEHFHLICERCGKLIHLQCDEVEHLLTHIKDEHGFMVDMSKINLYGLCEECQKKAQ